MLLNSKLIFGLILGLSLASNAGKLQSYCFMDENSKKVIGHNVDEKLPLASVSKVLTSLAVLATLGARTKLYTQFYASAVSKDLFDVHIKGSRDPYFSRASMQTLISRLNEMGVKKIRTLTFDENFKYLHDSKLINRPNRKLKEGRGRFYNPVTGKSPVDAPAADFVRMLLLDTVEVTKDYEKTKREATKEGVKLVDRLSYDPRKIEQVRSTYVPPASALKGYVSSLELIDIVKYMNWNSNNHVANSLFLIAGGKEKIESLYYDKFKFSRNEITFVNGSGQNASMTGREYTEGSCAATVRALSVLKKVLEGQKLKLEDAIAVNGGDVGSTVDAAVYKRQFNVEIDKETKELVVRREKNQKTVMAKASLPAKTVIAKTGTVGVAVTLAGLMSTRSGNQFFMVNVEPRQMRSDRARENEAAKCRVTIGGTVAAKMAQSGGGVPLNYAARYYDAYNFEDSGDPDAPELAEDAQELAVSQGAVVVSPKTKPSAGAVKQPAKPYLPTVEKVKMSQETQKPVETMVSEQAGDIEIMKSAVVGT